MAHNWQIAGHKNQLEFLSKSINSKSLAHGLIFAGPQQVGKRAVARNLARILLCQEGTACQTCIQCKALNVSANADYIEIGSDEAIKIEEIRKLGYSLSLKPYAAAYKVAVIDNAENMTVEAANALLKVLEEPKPHTILILITANPYKLLPTISSRAQKISFGLVAENDFAKLLDGSQNLAAIKTFAAGRPGLALDTANDSEALENINSSQQQYENYLKSDLAERLVLAMDLADYETPSLKKTLQFWLSNLERTLLEDPSPSLAQKISAVNQARNLLDFNVNSKLLLTNMMINS
jgi:DNA polymerase III subunit delta'